MVNVGIFQMSKAMLACAFIMGDGPFTLQLPIRAIVSLATFTMFPKVILAPKETFLTNSGTLLAAKYDSWLRWDKGLVTVLAGNWFFTGVRSIAFVGTILLALVAGKVWVFALFAGTLGQGFLLGLNRAFRGAIFGSDACPEKYCTADKATGRFTRSLAQAVTFLGTEFPCAVRVKEGFVALLAYLRNSLLVFIEAVLATEFAFSFVGAKGFLTMIANVRKWHLSPPMAAPRILNGAARSEDGCSGATLALWAV